MHIMKWPRIIDDMKTLMSLYQYLHTRLLRQPAQEAYLAVNQMRHVLWQMLIFTADLWCVVSSENGCLMCTWLKNPAHGAVLVYSQFHLLGDYVEYSVLNKGVIGLNVNNFLNMMV
jgi:hypothetical protein